MRGTFANVRLRNQMAPGTEGGFTLHQPSGDQMTIYGAAVRYAEEGVPLVVLAGKEYGSGSSRDWAAKGTALLGVRAVLAESYERIHRSNLVGMGVLPLQYAEGQNAASLSLTGREVFEIRGLDAPRPRRTPEDGTGPRDRGRPSGRVRGAATDRHADGGAVLPKRRDPSLHAASDGGLSLSERIRRAGGRRRRSRRSGGPRRAPCRRGRPRGSRRRPVPGWVAWPRRRRLPRCRRARRGAAV